MSVLDRISAIPAPGRFLACLALGLGALASGVWTSSASAEPPARFVDPGDGTVIDRDTGLRWQKCSYGQRYDGRLCTGTAIRIRWHDALDRCGELSARTDRASAAGLPPGGDWQLPLQKDLESLLVYRPDGARPFIDLDFFPSSFPLRYWSGSSQIDSRGTSGVVVNFLEGSVYTEHAGVGDSDGKNYVRCVDVGRRAAASISSFIDRK
jgi:hypothetical protein